MRWSLLRGREHLELGAVGAVAEGPAAICISKGGAAKTYSHVDPNEDAALFALGQGGALVAVADGHHGASGAEAACEYLIQQSAPAWTAAPPLSHSESTWREIALDTLEGIDATLASSSETPLQPARSTLSFALVRFAEGCVLSACVGDSHLFAVREDGARGLLAEEWNARKEESEEVGSGSRRRHYYLGSARGDRDILERSSAIRFERTDHTSHLFGLVLATDGLSERGIGLEAPASAVEDCFANAREQKPELRPLAASKSLAAAVLAAQHRQAAGDNLALATLWLEGSVEAGATR